VGHTVGEVVPEKDFRPLVLLQQNIPVAALGAPEIRFRNPDPVIAAPEKYRQPAIFTAGKEL
jgi:hypothetical protein